MNRRLAASTAALAAVAACSDVDVPPRGEAALIGAAAVGPDTVEMALIGTQRELIGALARDDSMSLGRYLSAGLSHMTRGLVQHGSILLGRLPGGSGTSPC